MPKEDSKRAKTDFDQFEVFPWNKNLETGHSVIDEQHMVLVDLLNKLARTLVSDEAKKVNDAFDGLAKYADFHFNDEEIIWSEYFSEDYWLSSHQMAHASFLPKVVELKEQKSGKQLTEIIEDIVKFLIRWLAFHIIDNDKRMAMAVEAIDSGSSIEEAKISADKKMSGSMRVLIETILKMYDGLSSSAMDLMRERHARIIAEKELIKANKQLEKLSITDQLTGLFNRRYFNEVFPREVRRAKREKKPLTFLMIDIDYFKYYNDNYGHLEGDKALEKISESMFKVCRRPDDFVFRLGGEEFGIIAAGLSNENALTLGEKIRESIENLQILHAKNKTSKYMTISIGLSNQIPAQNDTFEEIIKVADDRLYQAKNKGRNQVVFQ
jgi:diguanylate cyclase (GGDEF)-like protein/hemerythrin-like metal-binding protein